MSEKIDIWFESTWGQLPTFLFTSQTKGSKKMALDELKKLKPDENTLRDMRKWLKDKEEIDKQLKNTKQFVAPWPHFHRMLKRQFWLDDLPTLENKRETGALKACQCGKPVDHSGFSLCWGCYDNQFGNSLCGHGVKI